MTTLTIYMKSGNHIRLPFIKDWSLKHKGNEIVELQIKCHGFAQLLPCQKLIVPSIDLSSIEAITTT